MDQEEKNRKEHAKIRAAKEAQRLWDSFDPEQKVTAVKVYTEYYNEKMKGRYEIQHGKAG